MVADTEPARNIPFRIRALRSSPPNRVWPKPRSASNGTAPRREPKALMNAATMRSPASPSALSECNANGYAHTRFAAHSVDELNLASYQTVIKRESAITSAQARKEINHRSPACRASATKYGTAKSRSQKCKNNNVSANSRPHVYVMMALSLNNKMADALPIAHLLF